MDDFCPIYLIHLIGRKVLHFEKTKSLKPVTLYADISGKDQLDTMRSLYSEDDNMRTHFIRIIRVSGRHINFTIT